MKFFIFITLFILQYVHVSAEDAWSWSWRCESNYCKKFIKAEQIDKHSTRIPRDDNENTLQICRLTCGKYGALWPMPTIKTELGKELIRFNPSTLSFVNNLKIGEEAHKTLKKMMNIFSNNLYLQCGGICDATFPNYLHISIQVKSENSNLTETTEEDYSLQVDTEQITEETTNITVSISASTIYGIRHGLETLSQLTARYVTKNGSNGLIMVSSASIQDKPCYNYRGLLIDTARNYMTLKSIKRQLDGMAASKLNVFHWHITDTQSFPLILPSVMNMAVYGAYSLDKTYSLDDIKYIKEYAKIRGIRLIMEIDAPAHAGNGWQWGPNENLGNLAVCVNKQPWRSYCVQPPCGQLNPVNPQTYKVLQKIYNDLVNVLTAEEYFHMGGDEIFIPCWNSTEEIVNVMKVSGLGTTTEDFLKLWSLYQTNVVKKLDEVTTYKKKIILWSSLLTDPKTIQNYLPDTKRTIVQTWVPASDKLNEELMKEGYSIIVSTKDAWYLDHGLGHGSSYYHTWRDMYKNRIPVNEKVLGGEACLWSEIVYEESLDLRIWPRAAAVAERLWSNPFTDPKYAEPRFYIHRQRLINRNIHAEMVAPDWCIQNEGECQ